MPRRFLHVQCLTHTRKQSPSPSMISNTLKKNNTILSIAWSNGTWSTYHAPFLRHTCSCPICTHSTGQRTVMMSSTPTELHMEIRPVGQLLIAIKPTVFIIYL